jgi:phospholipase/lecithinase/hemolysin
MDQGNTITLTKQIEYFAATKSKMAASSGGSQGSSPSVDELLSKSLFLISDGGNDMFAFLQQNRSASEVPSFYSDLLSNYTRHLRALHGLGARRFGIVDVPPLGCVPSVRVTSPDGASRCVEGANALAKGFNDALRALLANLTAPGGALPGARYSVGSSYNVVSQFTAHPAAAGFREVASACCGGGRLNAQTGCTPNATCCSDRDRYLFWDGVHGTQATSRKGAVAIFSAPPQLGFAAPINFKQLVST